MFIPFYLEPALLENPPVIHTYKDVYCTVVLKREQGGEKVGKKTNLTQIFFSRGLVKKFNHLLSSSINQRFSGALTHSVLQGASERYESVPQR